MLTSLRFSASLIVSIGSIAIVEGSLKNAFIPSLQVDRQCSGVDGGQFIYVEKVAMQSVTSRIAMGKYEGLLWVHPLYPVDAHVSPV